MSIIVVGSTAFDDIETPKGKKTRVVGGLVYLFLAKPKIIVVGNDFSKQFFQIK